MLGRYLNRVPKRHYCDFRVYHHTAQVFLSGKDIYVQDSVNITPFKYSPFFAFLTSPLGVVPIKPAAAAFFIFNFLATIILFRYAYKLSVDKPLPGAHQLLLYVLGILFVSRFILQAWDSGQVPIIMSGLVLVSLYLFKKGKEIPASAMLAGSIMIKYLPAIFIPYYVIKKKYKAAGLIFLFVALWLFVPALYTGFAKNNAYLASWLPSIVRTSLDQSSYFDCKNQSFFSMVLRTVSDSPCSASLFNLDFRWALMLGYLLAIVLYMFVLIPGKTQDRRVDYALMFTFLPLFNPNGWLHNFVALAFPYIFLLNYLREVRCRDYFVLILVIGSFLFTSVMSEGLAGDTMQNLAETLSFVTLGTLLLSAALIKLKFSRPVTAN